MKSALSLAERISRLRVFLHPIAIFFGAKTRLHSAAERTLERLSISQKQLRQNIILANDGTTMYAVITDLRKTGNNILLEISRPGLKYERIERKLGGSVSSLLSGYYTKFYRRRDYERIIPALTHEFAQSCIAHQLRLANYSIQQSLGLLKDFEKLVLRSYEGEPVCTAVCLTRNLYQLRNHQEELGIFLTPVTQKRFDGRFLRAKRDVLAVNGETSVFLVNRKKNIRAIASPRMIASNESLDYIPHPQWMHSLLHGRDWVIRTTSHREIELICSGHMILRYKHGTWSTVPIYGFYSCYNHKFSTNVLARLLYIIEVMRGRRLGALFVLIPSCATVNQLIHNKPRQTSNVLSGQHNINELDTGLLVNLASVDGAVVMDYQGKIHASGVHIKPSADMPHPKVEGTRTAAAIYASAIGYSIKLSHDGDIEVYHEGKKLCAFV